MLTSRLSRLVPAALLAAVTLTTRLEAQRERATIRVEALGGTAVAPPTNTVARDEFSQQSLQVTLAHRFVRQQGRTIVAAGALWRNVRAALPREKIALRRDTLDAFTSLDVLAADLTLVRRFGTRHSLVAVARPGLYGETFRVEGAAFIDRAWSPRTTLGAGLSYASTFGELLPIPVLHVVTRPSARLTIDALLPSRADVWLNARKGLDLGVNASLTGALYGIEGAVRVNGATALQLANATLGPQLRWAPRGGKLLLTADAGTTILRRLEYVRDGKTIADLSPGNVGYARLGAQWVF